MTEAEGGRPIATKALAGLTVLEISDGVAAAYCGHLLAAYGARVLLVEPPSGSRLRRIGPFASPDGAIETGAMFLTLGAGKESLTLDAGTTSGVAVLEALCAPADVLLTDGARRLARFGFGYESLTTRFPRLVFASVSPFGDSGPYADFSATSSTLYALGGYTYLTGDRDREPLQGPEHQPQYLAGASTYIAVLAAVMARKRTGRGQRVEVSEFESMVAGHQSTLSRYSYSGYINERTGNRYMSLAAVDYYSCADGVVGMAASSPAQVEALLKLMGRDDMLQDERFSTHAARNANADAFDAEIAPWFAERTRAGVVELCQLMRVPAAPALEVDELLDHEQLLARGFWHVSPHPVAGDLQLPGPPFRMPESPYEPSRAPLLGEHSSEAYAEFAGLDAATQSRLYEAGVL